MSDARELPLVTRTERFNRSRVVKHDLVPPVAIGQDEIAAMPGLLNASLQDAAMYGGPCMRHALSTLPLVGDRKHVIVDAKVHMLMPGMVPAIPGWHTDGVPRNDEGAPWGPLAPDLRRQEGRNSPRYHLLVVGCDAPTVFIEGRDLEYEVPSDGDTDLYAHLTEQINGDDIATRVEIPMGQWWSWDWWELHSAQPSRERGWRLLIRVTESDFVEPETELRNVIRTHQQAYIQGAFGW